MNSDRDYQVFRLGVRKMMPVLAMGFWPILIALLPYIWQLVQLIFADRSERDGPVATYEALRSGASRAEYRALKAFREADREVPR